MVYNRSKGENMKRLLATLLLLLLLVPQVISAGADYSQVGTINSFECIKVTDKAEHYKLIFTIESKVTESFTAFCPVMIAPMNVMPISGVSKYRVRMNQVDNEWYIQSFDFINEIKNTQYTLMAGGMPKSVEYNRDAVGDEWMVRVTWGSLYSTPFEISAKAVQKLTGETTIDEITNRVSSLSQKLFEEWTKNSNPPEVLSETQRIEVLNNQTYLVETLMFFGFHLYALDDPLTPENELSFTTIISTHPLPDNWW